MLDDVTTTNALDYAQFSRLRDRAAGDFGFIGRRNDGSIARLVCRLDWRDNKTARRLARVLGFAALELGDR